MDATQQHVRNNLLKRAGALAGIYTGPIVRLGGAAFRIDISSDRRSPHEPEIRAGLLSLDGCGASY